MIVAIDGPAGTGKSTIAQMLALRLNSLYFDSGALYRLFALHLVNLHSDLLDENKIIEAFNNFDFDIKKEGPSYYYYLDSQDVTTAIRQQKISEIASLVSKNPTVRERLLPFQRSFGLKRSIVMEGRDIGTVIFPNADFKFFLTASPEIRAKRRLDQLKEKFPGRHFEFSEILNEQIQRDHNDSTREIAPMKKDKNAYLIDTTHLSLEQVLETMIKIIEKI